MPDVQLLDVPDGGDGLDVVIGQTVPRVHGEAARAGVGGGPSQRAARRVALPPGAGVASGVQLDRGNAERGGPIDGLLIWIDEATDADAGGGEASDGRAGPAVRAAAREAAFGRDLPAPLGDERRLNRL